MHTACTHEMFRKKDNLAYHCLLACHRPYRDLWSLQTCPGLSTCKPSRNTMYTSSFKSPCKKALLFTSNCFRCHWLIAVKANKSLTIVSLATGDSVQIILPLYLSVVLSYRSGFVPFYASIRFVLDHINPSASNSNLMLGNISKNPSIF